MALRRSAKGCLHSRPYSVSEDASVSWRQVLNWGLGAVKERDTGSVSCGTSKAAGAAELKAGSLFKATSLLRMQNASCTILIDQVVFLVYPLASLSQHLSNPHRSHLFCLLVLPSLSLPSVPAVRLRSVAKHTSRMSAEPWRRCSLPERVRRAATGRRSQPAVGTRRLLAEGLSKPEQIGRTHKHSLDQKLLDFQKSTDASSNCSQLLVARRLELPHTSGGSYKGPRYSGQT